MARTGFHGELKKFVRSSPSFKEKVDEYVQRHKQRQERDQFFYRHIKSTISRAQKIALARLRQDYPELTLSIALDDYKLDKYPTATSQGSTTRINSNGMATENNTGDGSTVLFSFTFPYIETTDIKVSLDGRTTEYTLANATTVEFNVAPADDAAIRIYRDTSVRRTVPRLRSSQVRLSVLRT